MSSFLMGGVKAAYRGVTDAAGVVKDAAVSTFSSNIPVATKAYFFPLSKKENSFAQVILVGLRNLAPYHFQPIQNPFIEFEVSNESRREFTVTRTSKKCVLFSSPNTTLYID